jgi:hypothetical protein
VKCGFCNGPISNEEGEMPITSAVRVMGPKVWAYEATAYACPHCNAVLTIEKPPAK